MFNFNLFEKAYNRAKDDFVGKCLIMLILLLGVLFFWGVIHIEMWLYESVVIDAMGAPLNKIGFWDMVGLNLLCEMLTNKGEATSNNKKGINND